MSEIRVNKIQGTSGTDTAITLSGANSTVNGTLNVDGAVTLDTTLGVTGNSTIGGTFAVTGVHTIGNNAIITSEGGAVTSNVVGSTMKNFTNHNNASTVHDSFNQASTTDVGTGIQRSTFTNAMGNANYLISPSTNGGTTPSSGTGAYVEGTVQATTALYDTAHGYSGGGGGTTWTLHDYAPSGSAVHGDLA